MNNATIRSSDCEIVAGYRPGMIGRCLELQALYYARHTGFGEKFETGRAVDIAEFFSREGNIRSRFWSALADETIVGTIAIDAAGPGENQAQLRWFVVSEEAQGLGIGRRLMSEAIRYCDEAAFAETHLWTFAGLDAARTLYERAGFVLIEESPSTEWGPKVLRQHFVRRQAPA